MFWFPEYEKAHYKSHTNNKVRYSFFHSNHSKRPYITLFASSYSVAVLFTPSLTCSGLKSFQGNKGHKA